MKARLFLLVFATLLTTACSHTPAEKPLVIAHRGASGYLPEHTLAAYQLAIDQGADYIEPDLVMTKDGHLIARHENEISTTTNVAQVFPGRKRTKTIEGKKVTGWFTEDFTLKEIKRLRARQRLAFRTQRHNDMFMVPTFAEILEIVQVNEKRLGRRIGIYPELKHPAYFAKQGLAMEQQLVRQLQKYGYTKKNDPILIQSFEVNSLRKLSELTDLRLVQLIWMLDDRPADNADITYRDLLSVESLLNMKEYLYGIGIFKQALIRFENGKRMKSNILEQIQNAGLKVHVYTFRSDREYLPAYYDGQADSEYIDFFKLGVDGVFSDFPDAALRARAVYTK